MRKVDYGLDSPGLVQAAIGIGMSLLVAGVYLALGAEPRWMGPAIVVVSLVPLAAGASLILYASRGKRRVRDRMLGLVNWRGDERVVDVGTGLGLLAIGAARRTRGPVIGIDVYKATDLAGNDLETARGNAVAEGVTVDFRIGDARALPLDDGAFDVVLCLLTLSNIGSNRAAAVAELARVLAPGGTLVIADRAGVAGYAAALRAAGLSVEAPVSARREAGSAMTLVRARRPL